MQKGVLFPFWTVVGWHVWDDEDVQIEGGQEGTMNEASRREASHLAIEPT